ncbi:hypothetical protein B0F90DRAFT_1144565 [Multifurca ochricompacta]|uniref:Uncharacterized protein n=1 Tax=Multifurca ochricompacta TaxID=376703 RepID=A0AAD4LYW6_9AGAM|nr:hypothetical protein B0F90DRAFT_1144565 [Multifurca ochricompacta]
MRHYLEKKTNSHICPPLQQITCRLPRLLTVWARPTLQNALRIITCCCSPPLPPPPPCTATNQDKTLHTDQDGGVYIPFNVERIDVLKFPPGKFSTGVTASSLWGPLTQRAVATGSTRSARETELWNACTHHHLPRKHWTNGQQKIVAGAAAVLVESKGGQQGTHRKPNKLTNLWCLGSELTQYDAELHTLAKTMEWSRERFTEVPLPLNLHFCLRNVALIQTIQSSAKKKKNNSNYLASILTNLKALTETYTGLGIHLVWIPQIHDSEAQKEAHKVALQNMPIKTGPQTGSVIGENVLMTTPSSAPTPSETHPVGKTTLSSLLQLPLVAKKQQRPTLLMKHGLHSPKVGCQSCVQHVIFHCPSHAALCHELNIHPHPDEPCFPSYFHGRAHVFFKHFYNNIHKLPSNL